jgi:hypothetical protein
MFVYGLPKTNDWFASNLEKKNLEHHSNIVSVPPFSIQNSSFECTSLSVQDTQRMAATLPAGIAQKRRE